MQHRYLLPLLLPVVLFAACREDQPPTAPVEGGDLAESHTPGHKVVSSLADPGDGVCNAAQCTLREAIEDPQSTEISFVSGLAVAITLAPPGAGGGTLTINKRLSITGPGTRIVIRSRSTDPAFGIFAIGLGGTVTLTNLIIRGGKLSTGQPSGGISNDGTLRLINSVVAGNSGAGIFNSGTLTLTATRVSNNSGELGGGIRSSGTLRLTNSVVVGNSAGSGAGIFIEGGVVTLTDSRVAGNSAAAEIAGGGGIHNDPGGELTLRNSTVAGNSATGVVASGGGIGNFGTLRLTKSTVAGNSATGVLGGGGGISNSSNSGGVTLTNSTVSANSTNRRGGGIRNSFGGELILRNSTVSGNSAEEDGGGITNVAFEQGDAASALTNSLVALNSAPRGPDVLNDDGTVTARFSLIGIGNASGVIDGVNGNQVGTLGNPLDPKLGPLANNGGPTRTHALLLGSPAIDAASTPDCPTTDQRGVQRPQGAACDIGSYERE